MGFHCIYVKSNRSKLRCKMSQKPVSFQGVDVFCLIVNTDDVLSIVRFCWIIIMFVRHSLVAVSNRPIEENDVCCLQLVWRGLKRGCRQPRWRGDVIFLCVWMRVGFGRLRVWPRYIVCWDFPTDISTSPSVLSALLHSGAPSLHHHLCDHCSQHLSPTVTHPQDSTSFVFTSGHWWMMEAMKPHRHFCGNVQR